MEYRTCQQDTREVCVETALRVAGDARGVDMKGSTRIHMMPPEVDTNTNDTITRTGEGCRCRMPLVACTEKDFRRRKKFLGGGREFYGIFIEEFTQRTMSAAPIAPACRASSRPPLNSTKVGMLRMRLAK